VSHKRHFQLQVINDSINKKLECLKHFWHSCQGPVAVGFSGGVDSSFLLITGLKWCKQPVYPFSLTSIFLSSDAINAIDEVASEIGVEPIKIDWNPLKFDEIKKNSIVRCYFCKKNMYTLIKKESLIRGCNIIVDGTQFDDLSRFRPGIRAILELDIQIPLVNCKFKKEEIRFLLEKWKYSFWNKKAESCLATRFNYGYELNEKDLKKYWSYV